MQISVTGHHLDVTASLKAYVESKFEKLERHFDHVTDVHVILTVEKLLQKAEATVQISGGKIFAEDHQEDMYAAIDGVVPDPEAEPDSVKREGMRHALAYMDLQPGMAITDIRPDHVFIGSCTNARIEDLRAAASAVRGRKIAANIKQALVVPGSGLVKTQAEAEGLDKIFTAAGFEWREPGCSMCLAMNADRLEPGDRCASTSNRNFEGRQGPGGRTHLVSPAMAAAAAVNGHFSDIRKD